MGRTSPGVRVYLQNKTEFRKILLEKGVTHKILSVRIGYCKDYLSTVISKGCLSYRASIKVAEELEVPWDYLFHYTEKSMQEINDSLFTAEELHLLKQMLADYKEKREARPKTGRGRPKRKGKNDEQY
jgi:hypothetical protein